MTTTETARAVLISTGHPGGYVRHLSDSEQMVLADVATRPRHEWPATLDAFWSAHRERLAEAKATIDFDDTAEEFAE